MWDPIASGWWGGFFGTVGLMVAGAVIAFVHALHRVALLALMWSLMTACSGLQRTAPTTTRSLAWDRIRDGADGGPGVLPGAAGGGRTVGVMVVSIGNLQALEQLHGRATMHHALFVTAGRLRRFLPANVEVGRLGDDGFLVLARHSVDAQRLVRQPFGRRLIVGGRDTCLIGEGR